MKPFLINFCTSKQTSESTTANVAKLTNGYKQESFIEYVIIYLRISPHLLGVCCVRCAKVMKTNVFLDNNFFNTLILSLSTRFYAH